MGRKRLSQGITHSKKILAEISISEFLSDLMLVGRRATPDLKAVIQHSLLGLWAWSCELKFASQVVHCKDLLPPDHYATRAWA